MKAQAVLIAAAAAALFIAGASSASAGEDAKVKCSGVNACRGKSACKSAANSCAGKNACKGKGYLLLTDGECEAAKSDAKPSK